MKLGKFKKVSVINTVGGNSLEIDIKSLESGVQMVSGTCGRIIDLINRNVLHLHHLKILVIDEADEILKNHNEEIFSLLDKIKNDSQKILVSATIT